ncbi:MAG: ABC transporter permease [Myxococcales bacterium]|nr:ABC transporter permease [Myxococcales bacterium]
MIELRTQVESLGDRVLGAVDVAGEFFLLGVQTIRAAFRGEFPVHETMVQFDALVVRSTAIVTLTALFTGMVLALQTVVSLTRFGAKPYTGSFVGLAFVLELGPVLTALMVSGRVGAGITAELGSMAVTEQVDAIRAMGADPVQKLVLPRVFALTFGLPMLTSLAYILGIAGGALIAQQYGITTNFYLQSVINVVTVNDVLESLSKTFVFGWMIATVGCYLGLKTTGGTVGVGRATTTAVVVASIGVLVSNFFLAKILMLV